MGGKRGFYVKVNNARSRIMLGSEVRGCGRHNVRRQAGDWLNMWSKSKSSQTQSPKLGQSPVRDQKRVTSRVRESSPGAGEVKAMSQKLQSQILET